MIVKNLSASMLAAAEVNWPFGTTSLTSDSVAWSVSISPMSVMFHEMSFKQKIRHSKIKHQQQITNMKKLPCRGIWKMCGMVAQW